MKTNAQPVSLIAIIPARGGSKGIPGKNIAPVAGRPLISYTIEAALRTRCISKVFVTTDDAKIAAIARQYGAGIIDRPAELSGDTASSESALIHALQTIRQKGEVLPEFFVFLQCTSPLTIPEDIDGTVDALFQQKADTAFTAAAFHGFVWKRNPDGSGEGINHDKRIRLRRQDKEPEFLETGAVYVMHTAEFIEKKHRFFGKTAIYETPAERLLDIDELADLVRAAQLLGSRAESGLLAALRSKEIKALVMDFDGVMTNDKVYISETGEETVRCSRGDGLGLTMLRKNPIKLLVLSKEVNPVVSTRCRKLQIECLQGIDHKLQTLQTWCDNHGITIDQVLYVGNDANDVECLQAAGLSAAPADAHPSALNAAQVHLQFDGGNGAVREICDALLQRAL